MSLLREMKVNFHAERVAPEHLRARLGETVPYGWQPFFQIFNFETDRVSIKFKDRNALCFFVDQPNLENGVFSDIHIRQV